MLDLGALRMSVIADTSNAEKEVESFSKRMSKAGESISKVGQSMLTKVTLPIVGLGTAFTKLASDVDENLNKVNAVFNASGATVEKWSNNSAKEFGMSKNAFLEYISVFGGLSQDLLKMNEEDSAEFAKSIMKRSADISSYYNMSLEQSNSLMQQLYSGETEGWKRLGITINDTTMAEFALSKGITKTIADMSLQEKTMLRIEMAMDRTKRAENDFTNTKDGLANATRILQAQLSDLSVVFGDVLLPPVTSVFLKVSEVIGKFTEFSKKNPEITKQIVQLAAVMASIAPVLLIIGKAITISTSLGATMAAVFSPISLMIAGVVISIAALALAWEQNMGGIRDKTKEAFDLITQTFFNNKEMIVQIFQDVWAFCQQVWEDVGKPLFATIGDLVVIMAQVFKITFPIILNVVRVAFDGIKLIWNTILKPVFDFLVVMVDRILEVVKNNLPQIQSIFEGVFNVISLIWENILKPMLQAFADKVEWLYRMIKPALDLLIGAFEVAFGWIINLIDKAISALERFLSLFDKAKNKSGARLGANTDSDYSETSYFANGGIMTRATMFGMAGNTKLVGGEAGAEAIIPLSKLPEIMKQLGYGGMGETTVNIHSPKALSVAETARVYKQAQRELAFSY